MLSANRAAERTVRLRGGGDGRARGRGADHPAVAARGAPRRARALPADGARAGRRAAGGADRDARATGPSSRSSWSSPGPSVPGEPRLLRLPARPDRALRRRGDAAPAGRRAGGAAAGGDGGRGRARARAAVRARQRGGRAAARGADGAHVPLRPRRARRARSSAAGRCGPSTCCRPGTRMPLDGDTAATRVWRTGPRGADGHLRRAPRASWRRRCAATACRRSSPRRSSSAGRCGARWSSPRWTREPFPEDAEQRIAYFAELAAQALANAQAREELAASRARIVAAGDAERRRLERNLHDGAQQRLVSLALMLRLAARRHPGRRATSTRAGEELAHALQELRELARGIHPAVLTERGLEPAVRARRRPRAAAGRARRRRSTERLPGPVEAAAYYVVSEALTNVAKYAERLRRARHASTASTARARIEVSDDGIGGANPAGGSGLRGLADRVEALGGRLDDRQPARRRHHAPRRDIPVVETSGRIPPPERGLAPLAFTACPAPSSSSTTPPPSGRRRGCCWRRAATRSWAWPGTWPPGWRRRASCGRTACCWTSTCPTGTASRAAGAFDGPRRARLDARRSALGDVERSGARGFVPKAELASPRLVELLGTAMSIRVVIGEDQALLRQGIVRLLARRRLRGRGRGRRRARPAAQGRRAQARRRDRRRPDAARQHRRRAARGARDPRHAAGGRRARALASTPRSATRST